MAQVLVSPHPLVQHKLTLLRRTITEPKKFRELVRELTQFLLYEATLDLPLNERRIETPLAPLVALFLGAYAANKVQGFALQKALGVLLIAPFIGTLLPMPWRLLIGLVPTYWPAALLWALQDRASYAWAVLAVGVVYQSILLLGLLRRFNRLAYQ